MKLLDVDTGSAKLRPLMELIWGQPANLTDEQKTTLASELTSILSGWSVSDLASYMDGLESTDNLEIQFAKSTWGPAEVEFYDTTR